MTQVFRTAASAGTALAVVLLAASPASAAVLHSPQLADTTNTNGAFCTGLASKANAITSKLNGLNSKVGDAWKNQDTKLSSLASETDQKIASSRTAADTKRDNAFKQLEAKATTDSEKTAVQTYEASVNQAVTTRRNAYDAARSAFRDGVKNAILSRRSTMSSQATTFMDATTSAFATAESSCSAGTDSTTVRQTLISSLHSARQTFVSDRQSDSKVGDTVKQLAATRNAAFKAADQAFQTSLQNAAATLKAAFGNQASSID